MLALDPPKLQSLWNRLQAVELPQNTIKVGSIIYQSKPLFINDRATEIYWFQRITFSD